MTAKIVTRCPRCGTDIPPPEYLPSGKMRVRQTICRECRTADQRARRTAGKVKPLSPEARRNAHLKNLYGITQADYEVMFAAQDGLCACCGQPSNVHLHVDHDHTTGAVRALLCGPCNRLVGHIESPRLALAMSYLEGLK